MNVFSANRWVVLVVSVAVSVVAVAWAAIPDSNGVIHGCYQRNNGNLRVIDTTAACRNDQTALNWSEQGPAGAQGPTGPQGSQGPQGPTGPAGADGAAEAFVADKIFDPEGHRRFVPLPTGQATNVISLHVPPGAYAVTGSGYIGSLDEASTNCDLLSEGTSIDTTNLGDQVRGMLQGPFVLMGATTFSNPQGGTLTISCTTGGDSSASDLKLVALRIGSVHVINFAN